MNREGFRWRMTGMFDRNEVFVIHLSDDDEIRHTCAAHVDRDEAWEMAKEKKAELVADFPNVEAFVFPVPLHGVDLYAIQGNMRAAEIRAESLQAAMHAMQAREHEHLARIARLEGEIVRMRYMSKVAEEDPVSSRGAS